MPSLQDGRSGEAAGVGEGSLFDQLRTVARRVDREMSTLQRTRHDPLLGISHDPEHTLLTMRAEIAELRDTAARTERSERAASVAFRELVHAASAFIDQHRRELDATETYLAQYGYVRRPEPAPTPQPEKQPPSPPPPPAQETDTPEEVQLSEVTRQLLKCGPQSERRLRPAQPAAPHGSVSSLEDDTCDVTKLLNLPRVGNLLSVSGCQASPPQPPAQAPPVSVDPEEEVLEVSPGLFVKRRSTLSRPANGPLLPASRITKENHRPVLEATPEDPTSSLASGGSSTAAASGKLSETPPPPVIQSEFAKRLLGFR